MTAPPATLSDPARTGMRRAVIMVAALNLGYMA